MRPIEWLITVALLVTANELDPPDDPVLSVVENGPFKFANLFFFWQGNPIKFEPSVECFWVLPGFGQIL